MKNDLKLSTTGIVNSKSGQLLIIDTCYLQNKYHDKGITAYENYMSRAVLLQCEEIEIFAQQSRLIREIKVGMSDDELIELLRKNSPKMEDLEAKMNAVQSKIEAFKHEPNPNPPYLMQGKGYVMFSNPIGDGYYPIIQTGTEWTINFNYPLKKDGVLDENKLEGKLAGRSAVDSGNQIIIDPTKASVKKNINADAYTILNLEPGKYECNFAGEENMKLSLKKFNK